MSNRRRGEYIPSSHRVPDWNDDCMDGDIAMTVFATSASILFSTVAVVVLANCLSDPEPQVVVTPPVVITIDTSIPPQR